MEKFNRPPSNNDPILRGAFQKQPALFGHLNLIVDAVTDLQNTPPGSGIQSVQAGNYITVDDSDPSNPIIDVDTAKIYDGMPQFESGAFTPVITNEINGGVITTYEGQYMRVGDVVTMSMRLDVQMDVGESTTQFNFSLPLASDFTTRYQLNGTSSKPQFLENCFPEADAINNLGICSIQSVSTGDYIETLQIVLTYQIL